MSRRLGMTLVEMIIATALFSMMMVLVIEAMINMRNLASTVDDMDILEDEAAKTKHAITRDLGSSGWFYCRPGLNGRKFYPQIHISQHETWQASDIAPPPEVIIPEFDPITSLITNNTYRASVTLNQATILGDALVFARLQPEGVPVSLTPAPRGAAIINLDTQAPVRLSEFAHARPVQSLVINRDVSDQSELTSVLWETTPAAVAGGLEAADLFDDNKVRLFSYRVIPDPVTGRGQLVRFYSNPDSGNRNAADAWIEDEVIANDVVSLRIYSFEMSTWYAGTIQAQDFSDNSAVGLTNNQLRFVVEFARNLSQTNTKNAIDLDDQSTVTSRETNRASSVKTLQFTIGLRSITNSLDQ